MSTASRAIASGGLKRRALSLGMVKTFDHLLQFLLPVVLVRCLDAATFGEYRLLWLAVGTVMAVATLNMPGSLYFFMPRSDPQTRRLYVHQTLLYLALAGVACAVAVSPWNPWLPAAAAPLEAHGPLVPVFIALWVASILLDYLPTIDERIQWQAALSIGVSLARFVLLAAGAFLTASFEVLLWLLLVVVVLKLWLLLWYINRHHGLGRPWMKWPTLSGQVRYAGPFGVSSALFGLRSQADQWVAATMFALHSFAAFSIAAILGQLVNVFRNSVLEAFLPSMSRFEAKGDVAAMMELNARGNVLVATLLFPVLGFVFVFAEELVALVYTSSYVEAAPVMRVYIVGLCLMVVEVGSMILLLRQGLFSLAVSAAALVVSALASWYAASVVGLAGAAAGSVAALYLDRTLTLRRISACAGIPLSKVQHWGSLALLLSLTVAACACAWGITEYWLPTPNGIFHMGVGGLVIAALYAPIVLVRRPH